MGRIKLIKLCYGAEYLMCRMHAPIRYDFPKFGLTYVDDDQLQSTVSIAVIIYVIIISIVIRICGYVCFPWLWVHVAHRPLV